LRWTAAPEFEHRRCERRLSERQEFEKPSGFEAAHSPEYRGSLRDAPAVVRKLSGGKSISTGSAWGTIGSYTPYTTRSRRLSSSTPAIVAVPTVDCDLKNSWDRRETAAMMGLSRRSFSAFLNDEPLYHRGHENH